VSEALTSSGTPSTSFSGCPNLVAGPPFGVTHPPNGFHGSRRGAAVRSSLMGKAGKRPRHGLSSDAPHSVEFFQRHPDDDRAASTPGLEFLIACPSKVQATMLAVLKAVAEAPPKRFAGSGHWKRCTG
jgi:hypothetical protein